MRGHLFELVAVNPGELLAIFDNRDVPGPHVTDEVAVPFLGVVELGKLVALPVRSNLDSRVTVLATDQYDAADDAVVVDTVDGGSTEHVLARSLKTVKETT